MLTDQRTAAKLLTKNGAADRGQYRQVAGVAARNIVIGFHVIGTRG